MRKILLASAAAPALLYALPSQAQTCTAAPDCATLGYTKTAAQCSGKTYTRCPFDTSKYSCEDTKEVDCAAEGYTDKRAYCPNNFIVCPGNEDAVRCVFDAKPGDLKYSLRTKDHDGWLLCNGDSYDPKEYPELYTAIGGAFGTKRPNYDGFFLKGAAIEKVAGFAYGQLDSLPNITGSGPMLDDYARDVTPIAGAFYELQPGWKYDAQSSRGNNPTRLMFDASRSSSVYKGRIQNIDAQGNKTTSVVNSSKVIPANYPANIFIFAGRKMDGYANACEENGYLSAQPSGQTCETVSVTGKTSSGATTTRVCYTKCEQDSFWEYCVKKYTSAYSTDFGLYDFRYCYDEHYKTCGKEINYIPASSITDVGCQTFADQTVSSCVLDEICMRDEFGIPIPSPA